MLKRIVKFVMSVQDEELAILQYMLSNPREETIEGVLAVGGSPKPEILILAYENGVFPWPHEGYPLLWFCPDQRGVIDFKNLHLPRSFNKWLKKNRHLYNITINQDFADVIKNCRTQKRKEQKGSWINSEIEHNYMELNKLGQALSLEVWRENKLVGGIYGVESKLYFSCESMFHLEDNTSKLALIELIQYLEKKHHQWIDIQMVTSVCEQFGGRYISKDSFLKRIKK